MYKSLSIISGSLIAIMILSNGLMAEVLGNTPSIVLVHIIGLLFAALLFVASKDSWQSLKSIPLFYLLAGVTGIATLTFTNIAFLSLGATVTLMLSMVGRIVTSTVIDHYGLMGMRKYPFEPLKFIGLGLMVIGVIIIFIL